LATYSPPPDAAGNRIRCQLAPQRLAEQLGVNLFASVRRRAIHPSSDRVHAADAQRVAGYGRKGERGAAFRSGAVWKADELLTVTGGGTTVSLPHDRDRRRREKSKMCGAVGCALRVALLLVMASIPGRA